MLPMFNAFFLLAAHCRVVPTMRLQTLMMPKQPTLICCIIVTTEMVYKKKKTCSKHFELECRRGLLRSLFFL